jgi:hypothetical protein
MAVQVIPYVWVLIVQKLGFSQGEVSRKVWGDMEKLKDLGFQKGKIYSS